MTDQNTTTSDTRLAGLLCSRLCHDLISPVGALSNGVEILADEDDAEMQAQALALLQHSAHEAGGKLRFFRLAFGMSGGLGDEVSLREAREVAEFFVARSKVTLSWQSDERFYAKDAVKLLMNMVLIGCDCLPRGGALTVVCEQREAHLDIAITAEGVGAAPQEGVPALLTGEAGFETVTARIVPAYLARNLADQTSASLVLESGCEGRAKFAISIPL